MNGEGRVINPAQFQRVWIGMHQPCAVEQREALIALLNQEMQTNMMIASDPNYAADVVDPPNVTQTPVYPLLSMAFIVSLVSGGIVGIMLHILLGWRGRGLRRSMPLH